MLENSQDNFDYFPSLGRRKEVEACWVKVMPNNAIPL